MARVDASFLDVGRLDRLSSLDSPIHRLDPRAKLLTTLVFLVTVISFDKHEVLALLPFSLFPVALMALGKLPVGYLVRKLVVVAPFAFFVAIANPFLDREPLLLLGPIPISGGWVSFTSILLRFALTVGAALALIATTSFSGVCLALNRMGVPQIMAVQLLFLHRYIFVLTGEAARLVRARALRSFGGRGLGMRVFASMVGQLLLRTFARAQRIHLAMLSRGFDGEIRLMKPLVIGRAEIVFTLGWSAAFLVMRRYNLPGLLGQAIEQVL
jgi:cobalt/nickel transport system permease protein